MLNRRFLRIKALQEIYAYRQTNNANLPQAERHLLDSINKLHWLFVYQLSFLVEVKRFAEQRIEENKQKNFPTEADLNPNLKFVNNRVLNALEYNRDLLALEKSYKINWADYRDDFIRSFYNRLLESIEYQGYMNNGKDSFEDDRRFLLSVIDNLIAEDDLLFDFYADRELTFNSDYPMAVYLLWKYINEMPRSFNESSMLPKVFKTDGDPVNEDRDFVVKLFEKTILHAEEYSEMVKDNASNWEYDRMALMDRILILMAMTEFCEFHSIPVKVTINEYIEISKYFSTPESRRFVNGMLDGISNVLKENGKIVKTGLGLVDK